MNTTSYFSGHAKSIYIGLKKSGNPVFRFILCTKIGTSSVYNCAILLSYNNSCVTILILAVELCLLNLNSSY